MAQSKRSGRQRQSAGLGPRELGLRAFQSGRMDEALAFWQTNSKDPEVARALAEVYFRRALGPRAADPLADLRRAATLAPADLRVTFHLGRLLHRAGNLDAAAAHYRTVLTREPGNLAAAKLLALLTLEQQPDANLTKLPGMTPALQAWLAPAIAVLHRTAVPADESAVGTFWRGLGQLMSNDPAAYTTLGDERSLPVPTLVALRRYYRSLAAALAGPADEALAQWQQFYEAGNRSPGLEANLVALLVERLAALTEAGEVVAAGALALRWHTLAGGAAFDEQCLVALDRAAHAAAASGTWTEAVTLWETARQVLSRTQTLGSPRPLLHNLALACERVERWEEAAEAWRALLRTRPRKGSAADAAEAPRWAWVRTRIIASYKHAGRPDEAIAVFRQALKLDPGDLDLRLQLADALYANEQDRAAENEIQRILELDPYHPEALLRTAEAFTTRWQFAEAQQLARTLVTHHPDRADLQRRVGDLFLHHGRQYSANGQSEAAYQAFVEGERFQPDNPLFPINQARMLNALRRPADTAALIERALTVAGGSTQTWVLTIETWMLCNKLDEARALINRFEQVRKPSAQDYLTLGLQLIMTATPPPPPSFFVHAGTASHIPDTPWSQLALEVLEKAVALQPNDQRMLKHVARILLLPRPEMARRFAERAVQLAPEDPEALILMGLILGVTNQLTEARTTLQRASQLARHQGRTDLHEQAQEFRRVVGTPMLRMLFTASLHGFNDLDVDEEFFG